MYFVVFVLQVYILCLPIETITFEGEEAPELTGNPFPFKESILKIMVPSGKSEAYKAKWDSYESYHSKIEEKS